MALVHGSRHSDHSPTTLGQSTCVSRDPLKVAHIHNMSHIIVYRKELFACISQLLKRLFHNIAIYLNIMHLS